MIRSFSLDRSIVELSLDYYKCSGLALKGFSGVKFIFSELLTSEFIVIYKGFIGGIGFLLLTFVGEDGSSEEFISDL